MAADRTFGRTGAAGGSGPRLQIELDGDVQLDRELLRFTDRVEDLSEVFTTLADRFLQTSARQFETEGVYSGGWAALRPATVRARGGSEHPILVRTGALRKSLTEKDAPGAIRRITATTLEVGTVDAKAAYHQHGTRRMARRRPVELSEYERRTWVKILQAYIIAGEREAGGAG